MENTRAIGAKIKEIRKLRGMTLQYLSEITNLSIGFLSNVERNQCSPTLSNLKVICDSLQVTISELLQEEDTRRTIIRDKDAVMFHHDLYPMTYKQINFLERFPSITQITMKPNLSFDGHLYRHMYYEIGYVLKGKLNLILEDVPYELNEGDSVIIRKNMLHSTYNDHNEECISLWVENKGLIE